MSRRGTAGLRQTAWACEPRPLIQGPDRGPHGRAADRRHPQRCKDARRAAEGCPAQAEDRHTPKGAEELAAKLKAIDEKLARDLFDYARTVVNIELPQGVVEVKRERPSPPPPTCAETESRARCPASGGGGSRHRGVRPRRCAPLPREGGQITRAAARGAAGGCHQRLEAGR